MRFMMLMIPKGYETAAPDAKAVAAMMKYNESLQKAGVLLALDGLHPQVIEIRQVQEFADFPADVREAAEGFREMHANPKHCGDAVFVTILAVVAALIGGVLVVAAMRPNTFSVQRSTTIKAPPDRVYPLIEDFYNWATWSPWEKLDPGMRKTFGGATRGNGAVYEWDGNNKAGAGRMEITATAAPHRLTIALDFTRPFRSSNTTAITLDPKSDSTMITWAMHGPQPFASKLFGLFVNMDTLIGKDFEQGLANIKAIAEQ